MLRKTTLLEGWGGLWETDGTPSGTLEVGIMPADLTPFKGGALFYGIQNGRFGLWVTNGTTAGTHELIINGESSNGIFFNITHMDFTNFQGKMLFQGMDASGNRGLWVTDGTGPGTHELSINGAFSSGIFAGSDFSSGILRPDFTVLNGAVLFAGTNLTRNEGLWITDGSAAATHELSGISGAAPSGLSPSDMVALKGVPGTPDKLLFAGSDASGNRGLWVSDGTSAGTRELAATTTGPIDHITVFSTGHAVFTNNQSELWVTDGTAAGTFEFSSSALVPGPGPDPRFRAFNGKVLFQGIHGIGLDKFATEGLWVTDGTFGGTHELKGISGAYAGGIFGSTNLALFTSPRSSYTTPDFTVFNNEVLFSGLNGGGQRGLWVTDGTVAGTHELSGIAGASALGIQAVEMTVVDANTVLFSGMDAGGNSRLWVTDGTAAGTHELSSSLSTPGDLTPVTLHVAPPDNFSGKNISDILLRNARTGEINFLENGQRSFAGSTSPFSGVVGTGDFDGDGTADILVRNRFNGDTGFYQVVNGKLQTWHDMGVVFPGYSIVGTGEFTVEGVAGVLLRNNSTADLAFVEWDWNNSGGQHWHQIQDPNAGLDPAFNPAFSVAGIGDFTGDGIDDILFCYNSSGALGYVQMKGDGTFEAWHDVPTDNLIPTYTIAGVGDFNGDGTADILFRNNATGKMIFEEMRNGVSRGFHTIGFSDPSSSVLQIGDFNGDDVSDVVLQDSNGQLKYFFNNMASQAYISGMVDAGNTGWYYLPVTPPPDTAPVVTVSNLAATHLQSFTSTQLYTASDAEGDPIAQVEFWNTGTGGGHFTLNGVAQGANQGIFVDATQLSKLSYQSGSGTDTLWVRANDGTLWGNWSNAFTVTAPIDNAPVVTASNVAAAHGQSFAASSLFTASDADGDAMTTYAFWNSGSGGGHFVLNGVAQGTSQEIDATAGQLSQLSYQSGSGADTLWVRADDGILWSNWSIGFTVNAPIDNAPAVMARANLNVAHGASLAAASLFKVSDADGDAMTKYAFWNSGTGGGHFLLNGVAQATNQEIDVTAAQLSQLTYQSGSGAETLWVRANDGILWGNWSSGFTVTAPIDNAPVVTAPNLLAAHGQSFAVSSLFNVTDADGDAMTTYAFWNSGSGGGHFMLNGVAQATGQEIDIRAAQLSQLGYQSGSGADALWVRVSDGMLWSNWSNSFTVTAPIDTGPVVAPTNPSIKSFPNQSFAASSLISYSDPFGSPAMQYDFWNSGAGGGHFLLNGNALPANQDNIISAAQLGQLTYQVGTGSDTLWARANDGTVWGAWSTSFTISDPPAISAGETITLGSAYAGEVSFLSDTGTLKLEDSSSFTGTVAGLCRQDAIDFADIGFGANSTLGYAANSDHSGGTLSVGDGTHTANIALIGSYMASTFAAASDGHGGTLISETAQSANQTPVVTQPHA